MPGCLYIIKSPYIIIRCSCHGNGCLWIYNYVVLDAHVLSGSHLTIYNMDCLCLPLKLLCLTCMHASYDSASLCHCLQTCGEEECMRYTNCVTCLYTIVNGAVQATAAEGCRAICDAENATIIADTISGPNDPRLDSTITCLTALADEDCSGIRFYVKPKSDGSAYLLVTNSPARECEKLARKECLHYTPWKYEQLPYGCFHVHENVASLSLYVCSSRLIWCIAEAALLFIVVVRQSKIENSYPCRFGGYFMALISCVPTLILHTLSFLLPVCPTSTSIPAWQIAVPTVVGFLILGFLVIIGIILAKVIFILRVRLLFMITLPFQLLSV